MKKALILLIAVFTLLILGAYFLNYKTSDKIQAEIVSKNYCENDSDCLYTSFGCPFGCWNYINKNENNRIKELVTDWHKHKPVHSHCMYKCGTPMEGDKNPVCINNKCMAGKPNFLDSIKNPAN